MMRPKSRQKTALAYLGCGWGGDDQRIPRHQVVKVGGLADLGLALMLVDVERVPRVDAPHVGEAANAKQRDIQAKMSLGSRV
jgi:hypothetical protein